MKMNKVILSGVAICAFAFVTACKTTENVTQKSDSSETSSKKEDLIVDGLMDEPDVSASLFEPVKTAEDLEYERSVSELGSLVSREKFFEDKAIILQKIVELDQIMKSYDYNKWTNYIDEQSKIYWSKRPNLQKAESKLPVKGLRLYTMQDYFKYVFVQSRRGQKVDEIRYVSENLVKAVQVREEQDIVYYQFEKIDGKWLVNLPPLDD